MPRRAALWTLGSLSVWSGAQASFALAKEAEEDALYSVGEQYNNLNACALNTQSCVSTQNDDEKHFIPPWAVSLPLSVNYAVMCLFMPALQTWQF